MVMVLEYIILLQQGHMISISVRHLEIWVNRNLITHSNLELKVQIRGVFQVLPPSCWHERTKKEGMTLWWHWAAFLSYTRPVLWFMDPMISSVGFGCNKLVEFPRMKSSSSALCYNDLIRHVCPEDHSSHLVIPLRNKVLFLSVEEQSPVSK